MAPSIKLAYGASMPLIGFGTYLGKKAKIIEALSIALDVGYRHIDTAISYENDIEIGNVLAKEFRSGRIKRKDLFITTKIPPIYMSEKDVKPCVMETLEKLQIKYVDMLLIHGPFGLENQGDGNFRPMDENGNRVIANHNYIKTWKAMEYLVKMGIAKALGLSNFCKEQIKDIMHSTSIHPENLQMECHAYLQQDRLRDFCQKNNIVATGYAPLGAPGIQGIKESRDLILLEDPTVNKIAEELNRTPGQILIKYVSHLGVIPLPKSITYSRIIENFEALNIQLSEDHVKRLKSLDRNYKYFQFLWAKNHPRFPTSDF